MIVEGPVASTDDVPVFLGGVACTGSEQSLSECSHNMPLSGGCLIAAITCGISSSE